MPTTQLLLLDEKTAFEYNDELYLKLADFCDLSDIIVACYCVCIGRLERGIIVQFFRERDPETFRPETEVTPVTLLASLQPEETHEVGCTGQS